MNDQRNESAGDRLFRFITVSLAFLGLATFVIYAHEFSDLPDNALGQVIFISAGLLAVGAYIALGYFSRSPWSVLVALLPVLIAMPDGAHQSGNTDIMWPTFFTVILATLAGAPATLIGYLSGRPPKETPATHEVR